MRKLVEVGDQIACRADLRIQLLAAGRKLFVYGILLRLGGLIFALDRFNILAAFLQGLFKLAIVMHDVVHVCGARKDLRNAVRVKNESEV